MINKADERFSIANIVDRIARSLDILWSPSGEEVQPFNFQYPLKRAL